MQRSADALRRSMLALIDHGKPDEAHPAYWAPFVVVGEGGAVGIASPVSAMAPEAKKTARKPTLKAQDWTADVWRK